MNVSIMDCLLSGKGMETFQTTLTENYRMNQSLTNFTKQIYQCDYKAQNNDHLQIKKPEDAPKVEDSLPLQREIEIDDTKRAFESMANSFFSKLRLFTKKAVSLATIELSLSHKINSQSKNNNNNMNDNDLIINGGTLEGRSLINFDETSISGEKESLFEAFLVRALLLSILSKCSSDASAFVVTPHRSQRSSILRVISDLKFSNSIVVDTVDSIQGKEADIVIICYAYFDPEKINRECEFLFDRRRLNVSVSRAKKLCIFIGSSQVFSPSFTVLSNLNCQAGIAYLHGLSSFCRNESVYDTANVDLNSDTLDLVLSEYNSFSL
jgi:hypothetical protein